MKIFIYTMYFLPDYGSAPILMAEMASFFAEKGYDVEVITTFPRGEKGTKYKNKLYVKEKKDKFIVKRFWTNRSQTPIGRFIAWTIYVFWSTLYSLLKVKKEDKLFLRLPPLQLGVMGILISKIKGAKFILNVQDIYPDLAIESGVIKNSLVIKLLKWLEKWIYRHSDCITVISEGFKENLRQKGVPESKIRVIPNWVDTEFLKPLPKDNKVAKKLGLKDKFVIMYAGTISLSSFVALENLIKVANLLRREKEIVFVIVGEGIKKKELMEKATRLRVENVKFLPFQSFEDVPFFLASSDLLVVPLDITKTQISVPSKLYTYMAIGRPIITPSAKDSEVARIINEAKCGMCIEPDNIDKMAEAILNLKNSKNLREMFGKNARKYAEEKFAKEKVLSQYKNLIISL